MRPPQSTILIHTANTIAFGPVGTLELSIGEVEQLHITALRRMLEAIVAKDAARIERERAAEIIFRAAMADHARARRLASRQQSPPHLCAPQSVAALCSASPLNSTQQSSCRNSAPRTATRLNSTQG